MNSCYHFLNAVRQPRLAQKVLGIPAISTPFQKFSGGSCNKKKALVILAKGFEEIELVTPVDVLRRGGVEVSIAGMVGKTPLSGVNCVKITPDADLDDICGPFDAVIITGDAKATKAMSSCNRTKRILKEQEKACKIIAAICCSPLVLMEHQIALKKRLTSHPDVQDKLKPCYDYKCCDVIVDDYLITARGPAQALQWALTILMHLTDEYNACCIAKSLLVK